MFSIYGGDGPTGTHGPLNLPAFFCRYLHLAGMTGTAREIRRELWSVYRLPVVKIHTNKPSRRKESGYHVYVNQTEKWAAVVRQIQSMQEQGRPVLIGTRSVGDSEHLSELLRSKKLDHQVLNARRDRQEAEIVASSLVAADDRAIPAVTNHCSLLTMNF